MININLTFEMKSETMESTKIFIEGVYDSSVARVGYFSRIKKWCDITVI